MSSTQVLFPNPQFKDQVFFQFQPSEIEIYYRQQACSLSVQGVEQETISQLLRMLQVGGFSLEQLNQACPDIQEDIPELLAEFNRRGLLVETQHDYPTMGVNGSQFYRELVRFIHKIKQSFPPSLYSQKMADGTITREQLIGYALESYHVTHLCPRLLAPALANEESPKTQKILQDFFVSELHHDKLISNSLTSVGIKPEQIETMQPLPMTFAVCSSLGVFAIQHPLTFKAALLIFEEDDKTFHELFTKACHAHGLPTNFYKPIQLHAGINEEGGHEEITKILLAEVPYVSPEEQLLVKKNLRILMESLVLRTNEIIDYYQDLNHSIPRCFN